MTAELYAKAWAAYCVDQNASSVAEVCHITPKTAAVVIKRGYPDSGFTALADRYRAEQLRKQSLERYPAEQVRVEQRALLAAMRANHRELTRQLSAKLVEVRKRINPNGSAAGLEIPDDAVWQAQRMLAGAGRDLTAMEIQVYGEAVTEDAAPRLVVVRDLGRETPIEDLPAPTPTNGTNGHE
jgi:hypothetical protein